MIIIQNISEVTDFSSQYGSDNTISYTASNITGRPSVYPNYGDSAQTFAFRSYGSWWSTTKMHANDKQFDQDFIEVNLELKICPYEFKIYESYNPGALIRIFAYNDKKAKWVILWNGKPQKVTENSRIFCPPIGVNNFLTDLLRIEFSHAHLDYYYELDAIEVTGSLLEFKNLRKKVLDPLSPNTEQSCAIYRQQLTITDLPSEVFTLILSFLNLESLCKAAQVCKIFRDCSYDSVLYQSLNLQPYWYHINNSALLGLSSRCHFLQELNLSWCGSRGTIMSDVFIQFYRNCGQNVLVLGLSNCPFVNCDSLQTITQTSPFLTSLSLKNNTYNSCFSRGLFDVAVLKQLQCLELYRTHIDSTSIIEIIRSCQNLEHLCLGSCSRIDNYDQVAMEIGSNLRKLKTLDLWRAKTLSALGVQYIYGGCPDLEDLDLGWCDCIDTSSGCILQLATNCTRLRRIILSSIRTLSDADLLSIGYYCPYLQQIDIIGTRDITPAAVERFLHLGDRLKLVDISFSAQITAAQVNMWKAMFPGVDIKKSIKALP